VYIKNQPNFETQFKNDPAICDTFFITLSTQMFNQVGFTLSCIFIVIDDVPSGHFFLTRHEYYLCILQP